MLFDRTFVQTNQIKDNITHSSRLFLTADKTKARGWIVSRFPRGICSTSFVSSGTAVTILDPLSTRRILSSKGWAFPSESDGNTTIRQGYLCNTKLLLIKYHAIVCYI